MLEESVPVNFDWVAARAECSLYKVFKELYVGVAEDVKKRNSARKDGEQVKFDVVGASGKGFSVLRESSTGSACIDFMLSDTDITVADSDHVKFTAAITLNNEGRCKLKVSTQELEQWQVRRMALEDLFFGSKF